MSVLLVASVLVLMIAVVGVIGTAIGIVPVYKPAVQMDTPDSTQFHDAEDDDLLQACSRLSRFLEQVNYRENDVPIGIRFENADNTTCVIQWSIGGASEVMAITEVAKTLHHTVDRLELQFNVVATFSSRDDEKD